MGNVRSVFGAPLVLGVVSLAGLLATLLGNEGWRYFGWPAVALPLIVAGWHVARARHFFFKSPRRF